MIGMRPARTPLAIAALLLAAVFHAHPLCAASSLAIAASDLQAGKADEAIGLLTAELKTNPKSAEAENLLCRVQYTLDQFDPAADHCEKAARLDPQNARYHLWLGRAIGERASRASFLSAFSLAKRTREEFEKAVQLDPKDGEALADLGQFYQEAPGAVGGGIDKAESVARKLEVLDPTRGHQFRAELAERRKDLTGAEQEWKAALREAPHPALQWMALASFYRRHERWQDMSAAIKSGQTAATRDRKAAIAYYNGASVLSRANRDLEQAVKLYETYLASPDKTEEAPAFQVLTRLAKLRAQMGDHAGAERDKAAALALAHEYKPAIEAKL